MCTMETLSVPPKIDRFCHRRLSRAEVRDNFFLFHCCRYSEYCCRKSVWDSNQPPAPCRNIPSRKYLSNISPTRLARSRVHWPILYSTSYSKNCSFRSIRNPKDCSKDLHALNISHSYRAHYTTDDNNSKWTILSTLSNVNSPPRFYA